MYRDDPLDDEAELRAIVGDAAVDELLAAGGGEGLAAALDALRILQGWIDEEACGAWLTTAQRGLAGLTPLAALGEGRGEDVSDSLMRFVAAQS